MSVTFEIDGQRTSVPEHTSLLQAARSLGIDIPTLCHHDDLSPTGSCRLCLVEIDGHRDPQAACSTCAVEGMSVTTRSDGLDAHRRVVLEMLLADWTPGDGSGETEFGKLCREYGVQRPTWARTSRRFVPDADPNPFIRVDLDQCILCTRCVRACDEVQGRFVLGVSKRGRETRIVAGADTTMLEARCESCGACAEYCPTDALVHRDVLAQPEVDRRVTTICPYCGVGCQFDLCITDESVVRVESRPDAPVNGRHLCVKGRYGTDFVHHEDRLTAPRVRRYLLDDPLATREGADRGEWVDVDWDTALDTVASRLASIVRESGGDAVGLLSSAKCSNEENYLVQKLARQVLGTNNVDHCARLCHSSTVAGLAMCFGSGAMSNSMADVAEQSAALFVIGSNTTEQHPVFGSMLRRAVHQRGVPLVVADPRRIDLCEFATLHLRQRPGTDVALLNGLMHVVLENGWQDTSFIESRCEEFDTFRDTIEGYPPAVVEQITGVTEADLREAARLLATNRPMAVIWSMGITQHTTGVINVLSLGNLQMLLGNMGVPGGGVNPLRGQNNVQGACDMGALPNVYPGYQPVSDVACRAKFQTAWQLDAEGAFALPTQPGLTVTEMVDGLGDGRIRGLYVLGENPAQTDPDSNHVRTCLERAEFVVLQEIFPSSTAEFADVLLPGTSFAERSGTFTNTGRRIQLFRRAIDPLERSRPDWSVVADLARRLLDRLGRRPSGDQAGWRYEDPSEVMQEIAAVTPSYAGISHGRLEAGESLQWPCPSPDHPGTPILHVDRFARGKGRFHAVDHLPPHEQPDDDYPLLLTTGRVLYHWHAGEMTRRARVLSELFPEPLVEISADDGQRCGIVTGDVVHVDSRRGRMTARAVVTPRVPEGLVFGTFHFPAEANVNNLTANALDPVAKIPEYKVSAVRLSSSTKQRA